MRPALLLFALTLHAAPEGELHYRQRCAGCHGANALGGERGPAIVSRLAIRNDADLATLLRNGFPAAGMPGTNLSTQEMRDLIAHLRTLRPARDLPETFLDATVMNKGSADMQLLGEDGRLHLLRRRANTWREIHSDQDWPSYNGAYTGNRHTTLTQITTANAHQLQLAWLYTLPTAQRLQVTPVVVGGVMYVTNVNEVHALDAGTGRRIWQYKRARTKGLAGDAASGINRGVAIEGDRLFMVTDHAHLIALNRMTGALLWDSEMADYRQNYGATAAPLVVGDLVISGISGGDEGARGFLDAYRISNGERAWRFWTVPAPGEPLSETWKGKAITHGCATTWLTGTYDPQLDLLYWPTGNPCPDYNGDERLGDNLYSDSVIALNPKTGKLAWYFQYTPHDLHDWDAQQTPMLIDADWEGKPRQLLAHANRNGFFYVLDRTNGKFLRATPFVDKLTWAKQIDANGRPIVNAEATPTPAGVKACPAVEGATNWFSTAFSAKLGLFYVQALEKCTIYKKQPGEWEAGKSYYDGSTERVEGEPGKKVLRALDIKTGRQRWQIEQIGPANSWGGLLSTESGVLFHCDDSGAFIARNAESGTQLWKTETNQTWKASPMTYMLDGKQYVSVAAGGSILSFAVPDK